MKFHDETLVFRYEYRCENFSLITPIFRRFSSEPLLRIIPLWLAPNCMTLVANLAALVSCAFVFVFAKQAALHNAQSTLWLLLPAFGILMYSVIDNADGLQAKRTNSSGPLGDFFDHWLDGITAFLIPLALFDLIQLGVVWQALIVTTLTLAYWTANWERLHERCMRLPVFGDVEANLLAVGFLVVCALFGLEFWSYSFFGIPLSVCFGFACVCAAVAAIAEALLRGQARWQIAGVLTSFSCMWVWLLLSIWRSPSQIEGVFLAPLLIGLVGAKHTGDLQRSHLIGVEYRPFDFQFVLLGLVLSLSELIPIQLLSMESRQATAIAGIAFIALALGRQFYTTTHFICQQLGLRLFHLESRSAYSHRSQDDGSRPQNAPSLARPTDASSERSYRLVYFSVPFLIVAASQLILWIWSQFFFEHLQYQPWDEAAWSISVSLLATLLIFQLVNLSVGSRPRTRKLLNLALTVAFLCVLGAHLLLEHPLDFYFVGNNFSEFFYSQSLAMATQSISFERILVGANVGLGLCALAIATKSFETWPRPVNGTKYMACTVALLVTILFSPLYRHNELTFFLRTAFDYAIGRYAHPGLPSVSEYPYVHRVDGKLNAEDDQPRPNIFIVTMESFNRNFVETANDDGRPFTPFFNSRIKEGVFVERFYGNSIQTARHYLPTYCSVLPSYWGKESTSFPALRVRSLAHILRECGYRTLYFQSQQDLAFDDIGNFLSRLGFDEVHGMAGDFLTPEDSEYIWGWGLQDDHTFKKTFEYLDAHHADSEAPVFVSIMTTSHHYPFNEMPAEQKHLYPTPVDRKQNFANSIHLSDKYLAKFFDELRARPRYRDSLVIITGDHSFPAGEHGNYFNEYRFYEENFRIPLLLWSPNRLAPQRIANGTFSQLDIAPTVLDLLNIKADNHFCGRSILDQPDDRTSVPMVQPYDGTHLCVVDYPLKYVRSLRVPGEYLFDLENDPEERKNLIYEREGTEALTKLRSETVNIQLNQKLLQDNRIWPSTATD